ncbi:hypothetical protein [Mesorhizobium sp. B2-6-5]|uniref:hypothetical protein n=1 Tax=Mesorhizobium sp. B2-6-5 TaxID=2589912 RepID=UPI00112D0EC3|nr:hypothetical protein [Mesorhizobium sp. B2-6-5]TPJ34266.1 hypothetical protein FJ432_30040 [Mesorhizobium sp. B2-6-5]
MAELSLASDATLRTVLPTLQKPEGHVRQILENMSACNKKHGNAYVRIGITGTGKVPYHQVSYLDPSGQHVVYGSFDGKNPFQESPDPRGWSSERMARADVMKLLGEIRGL